MQLSAAAIRRSAVTLGLAASLLLAAGPATSAWAQGGPNANAADQARAAHEARAAHREGVVDEDHRQNDDRRRNETHGAQVHSARTEPPRGPERAAEVRNDGRGAETPAAAPDRADRERRDGGQTAEAGDPNRGSVKIRSTGDETWPPRNEPHPGCEFWLHFHGFDTDDARAFRLYASSPTGDGQLVYQGSVELTDARGNGYSAVYPAGDGLTLADLTDDLTWPTEYEPHAQQGWHLRLEVDGPKHKMFWIDCDASTDSATDSASTGTQETPIAYVPEADRHIGVGSEGEDETFGIGGADEHTEVLDETFGIGGAGDTDDVAVRNTILSRTAVGGEAFGIGGAEPATDVEVLGVAETAGGASGLPVTGAGLLLLALGGLALVATGTGLLRGRRTGGAIA